MKLFGETDDDAFRAPNVGQAVAVLVSHFADEFGAVGDHVRNDLVDLFHCEHDSTDPQGVDRSVHGAESDRGGCVKFVEFDALPVRCPQHRERRSHIVEPDQFPDKGAFNGRFAFELEAKFDEKRLCGFQIVNDDKDIVHPFESHVPSESGVHGEIIEGGRFRWVNICLQELGETMAEVEIDIPAKFILDLIRNNV